MATATRPARALQVAHAYQADLAATGERLNLLLTALWRQVDARDPVKTWEPLLNRAIGALVAGQWVAAAMADQYVDDALTAQRDARPAAAGIDPAGFAGTAASGNDLGRLLLIPAERAADATGRGVPPATALDLGRGLLGMYARTETADAGRAAVAAAGTARRVGGYVRALRPPSCARCAILAGRWYRYSAAFDRHPHCDCVNVPAENDIGDGLVVDTLAAVRDGQVHGLTRAERSAIDLGADPSQVVNAREGMYSVGGARFTRTGTTRQGIAGARILARDMARTAGAAPGGVYRNFTMSRAEIARWQAVYGPLLQRGRTFTRATARGGTQTVAYRFTRTGRASVEDLLAGATSQDDAIRLLINHGYLL